MPKSRSGRVRKISPPTWIRYADRPALSEPLHRLRYPCPRNCAALMCVSVRSAPCYEHRMCASARGQWGLDWKLLGPCRGKPALRDIVTERL